MTVSAGIFFPLAASRSRRPAVAPTEDTVSPNRKVDAEVAQVVLERLDDLEVAELQHPLALLDDRYLRAEGGEHRGVLDPDHAGPGDDHRARYPLQVA